MAFWNRKKNWEDEYDEAYAQDRGVREPGRRGYSSIRFIPHFLTLSFAGCLLVGAVGAVNGMTMVEKMLTDLAMPIGLVWVALIFMVYFCLLTRQAWPALVGFACWLILTISGNSFCSNWLISSLEQPYQNIDLYKADPVDVVVVLGGGTTSSLTGESQLGFAGDRIATAARLFHLGKVQNIICTGDASVKATEIDPGPREEASKILTQLGVPPERVVQMKGKNTFEEMENLSKWMEQTPDHGTVGVLTSAWHLARVERLAGARGIEIKPLPCNFLSEPQRPSHNLIVPSSERIEITRRAMKEYLARLVSR